MKFRIAVVPGDGIGKEAVPEGVRVLEAVGKRFCMQFDWTWLDWGCELYTRTGHFMPEDGLQSIRTHDAIFLGAVGWPGIPDHLSLYNSAPDLAGEGIANPIDQIRSSAMMFDHLRVPEAARAIGRAVEAVVIEPRLITPDMGGKATTVGLGEAMAEFI